MCDNNEKPKRQKVRSYPAVIESRTQSVKDRKWEILIAGDFNDQHSDLLKAILEVPRNSRGVIYIDSNGGSVYTAIAISTMIRLRGLRATAVVLGECSSAALLPFAVCEERFVTAHSTHLFHPMKWESEENVRLEEAAEWTRHFREVEKDFEQLLARLLNFDLKKLVAWSSPGRFVSGQELVDAGLAKMLDPFSDQAAMPFTF